MERGCSTAIETALSSEKLARLFFLGYPPVFAAVFLTQLHFFRYFRVAYKIGYGLVLLL
jgi:hypothetical protein